jgi:tetratricopeptide (TPR) repeat protein
LSADIADQRGDLDEALRIRREVQLPVYERLGDMRETAVTWGKIADIAYDRGDLDEALRICRDVTLPVFKRLGDTRSTALTWGRIADIADQRGDIDEALRIRRDVELPAYERLGDIRSVAVTWGQIADIAFKRGELDEAAALRRKQLDAHRQLKDIGGIAAADWGLACIDLERKDYQSAYDRLAEAFRILVQLQRPDGLAVVGSSLGQLLLAGGNTEQAHEVLKFSQAAADKLGMTEMVQQINALLELSKPEDGS